MRSSWNRLAALGLMAAGVGFCGPLLAQERAALTPQSYADIRNLIRPQPGESRWQEVSWLLSVHAARKQAAAEGKPILIWSGGGCPPLGTC